MRFSKVFHTKKRLAIILFLLITFIGTPVIGPFSSVEASVGLLYFRAVDRSDFIMLEWETAQELDNLGFNLYRGVTDEFEDAEKINNNLIPSETGGATGAFYEWPDNDVEIGVTYTYWLEDIDINGVSTVHDPDTGTASGGNTIPTVPSPGGGNNTSTPTSTPTQTRTPTPSPTTQSASTSTPTRSPTRTPTTQPTSANNNPTPTTAAQVQATAATNNNETTPALESAPTNTPDPDNEQPTPTPTEATGNQAESETTTTGAVEGAATPVTLSQVPEETEESSDSAEQIGRQISADDGGEAGETMEASAPESSSRSTLLIMALIASVILLIAGGGGIIFLLVNRNKQSVEGISE